MSWEYEALRQIADRHGLVATGLLFLVLVGWTFRRGAHRDHQQAAHMIFDTEEKSDG